MMTYSAVDVEYPVRIVDADGLAASQPFGEDRCPVIENHEIPTNEEQELYEMVSEESVP